MKTEDRTELSAQARKDGARLFGVADSMYKVLIAINWIIGLGGGIGGLATLSQASNSYVAPVYVAGGIAIWIITAVACGFNYMFGVLLTHTAKVMVHTSLAAVGILEERYPNADSVAST